MMRRLLAILFLICVLFTSCVHEFPKELNKRVPFLLYLDFDTEMHLHKEVAYTKGGDPDTKGPFVHHDIRYVVNAYRSDVTKSDNRVPDTTFVFTKSDIQDLNYTAQLYLYEGDYTFSVWADYVDEGSRADKYYDTRDFSEIILTSKENHTGSNDFKDAFRGYASATVTNPDYYTGSVLSSIDNQATAEMKRPMGMFKFISTDVDIFLNRLALMMKESGKLMSVDNGPDSKAVYDQLLQSIDLGEYTVKFIYNAFMPCSFNMFTDKPADSWTGMSFTSTMFTTDNMEMTLGYDYIFVNGKETTLSVSVEVYNKDGELMSSTNPIDVPVVRNKMTLVKGEFLTSKATGGVTINSGYDGEDYNYEIL